MNRKSKMVIVIVVVLAILISGISYAVYLDQNAPTILKLQTTKREAIPRKPTDTRNSTYYTVKSNGKITKCPSFKSHNQIVEVKPDALTSYVKNNTVHLRIRSKYRFKGQFDPQVTDPNYLKLLNQIVRKAHHEVYRLQLYKVSPQSYYAYFQVNAGISDAGDLYHFNSRNNKLTKVCELDGLEIVGIKEINKK